MKTFFFDAGLPRSGSTLLSALLNQNPKIYAGTLSPVFEIMYNLETYFQYNEQSNAYPKPHCNFKIISSIIENYYADTDKPYVIDKCRAWTGQIQFIEKYITLNPKIICTVRNPLNILASFINLIHKNSPNNNFIDNFLIKNNIEVNDNNRCDFLMSPKGIVFNSLNGLAKCFYEKKNKNILIIEYEDLINNTNYCMQKIYDFLEIQLYSHSYDDIKTSIIENDKIYGLHGMHVTYSQIKKSNIDPENILSEYIINRYKNLDLWNQNNVSN